MSYQTVAIPMTLSGFEGQAPDAGLLKCDFSYIVQQLTGFKQT